MGARAVSATQTKVIRRYLCCFTTADSIPRSQLGRKPVFPHPCSDGALSCSLSQQVLPQLLVVDGEQ